MQSPSGRGASAAVDSLGCPFGSFTRPVVATVQRSDSGVALTDIDQDEGARIEAITSPTVYVCITCRRATDPEDAPRPGLALARATSRAAEGTGVGVRQVRCLANCNRALSAAIRCDDTWTYVFGGLEAERDAEALIEGARLLARAEDGRMPWCGRPEVLKRGLIARVPPLNFVEDNE